LLLHFQSYPRRSDSPETQKFNIQVEKDCPSHSVYIVH
jgi:hypothetical protein